MLVHGEIPRDPGEVARKETIREARSHQGSVLLHFCKSAYPELVMDNSGAVDKP